MSYSNKTHVILIKDEVRTSEVSLVREDSGHTGTYLVYYKRALEEGKGRLYQYSVQDIIILKNPLILDPRTHDVYYQGEILDNVYVICHFKKKEGLDYWTIGFADNREDIVCTDDSIEVRTIKPSKPKSTNITEYFTQMAYFHGYDLRANDNTVLLGEQYSELRRGEYAPLLEAYLNPAGFNNCLSPVCDTPIFPFYTNASQLEAVKNALGNRISIIQGPPGTGKTETILNIALNLVLSGKSVMVVAGSNSAVENVVEKLNEQQMGFLVAKLGRRANKEDFVKFQQVEALCPSDWNNPQLDVSASLAKVRQLSVELEPLFVLDRDLHEAIENGELEKAANLRRQLTEASYAQKREDLKSISLSLSKQHLYDRFGGHYCRKKYELEDLGDDSASSESFLKDYPIVVSTAFSASKCISRTSLFDYLIMDEASQVDVTSGALALSVARNAVIVGDVKQLPNVIKKEMKAVSESIFGFFNIPAEYNYANHSFLQSMCEVFGNVPKTLLREHYRCHPKIVRFFNKEFYDGKLVAMTEDKGEDNVLVLRTTVPGHHAAAFTNHREEEEIEDLKKALGIDGYDSDVGIITPYNNQVRRIDDDEDIEEDIMVSTVHKFQGRQKDVIIISTVDNKYTDFVNDPNLVNVAVSRAKRQLILVTNGNEGNTGTVQHLAGYIRKNNGRCENGKVKSLFDLIYPQYEQQYTEFIKAHTQISESEYAGQERPTPAEMIAYGFITDVLQGFPNLIVKFRYPLHNLITDISKLEDEEEVRFVRNKDSHIDFMIFEKDSMNPVIAIEIDGASYHVEGSFQDFRDKLKEGILKKYGIRFERFNTKKSIDEHSTLLKYINQCI